MAAPAPPPAFDPDAFEAALACWPTTRLREALADMARPDWADDDHDAARALALHAELWRRRTPA